MTDFRRILKVRPLPDYRFDPNAQIECVGVHIRAGGFVVGQVIGSEIDENRELILTVAIDGEIEDDEIDIFRHRGFD